MAIALVVSTQQGPASASNTFTTSAINTTGASLLTISWNGQSGNIQSISDSKGNSWSACTGQSGSVTESIIYYAVNPIVGAGHTFTTTSPGGYTPQASLTVRGFSGVALTSPLDQQNGTFSNSSPTSLQTGSVTPTTNNQLVLTAAVGQGNHGTITVNSPFNTNLLNAAGTGAYYLPGDSYEIQTTATARNPTWTLNGSPSSLVIATFKAASGGGGRGTPIMQSTIIQGLQGSGAGVLQSNIIQGIGAIA